MHYSPRPYQDLITSFILKQNRCAIFADMGMGKTSATLMALRSLNLLIPGPTLILAPRRVAKLVWPKEVVKWDEFKGLSVSCILGSQRERVLGLVRRADIYTMNYENLPWLVSHLGDKWPFTKVVADESTRLKSFRIRKGGSRAKELAKVAFTKIECFIALTGTPAPNGFQDLWGQMWFLDRGERLGRTYTAYLARWFQQLRLSTFTKLQGLLPGAQTEIEKKLSDICLSIRAKDWLPLTEINFVNIDVELPEKARTIYRKLQKELFVEIQSGTVSASNQAVLTGKCIQLASGALYTGEDGEFEAVHDAKLDALESIIEETGGAPLLVAYHFKSDLARIKERFDCEVFGEGDENDLVDRWNKGLIPLLALHPQSAGHGLNLQDGGNKIVFFTSWWNLEEHDQVIERIGPTRQLQAGHPMPVFVYYIRALRTLDEQVIDRRVSKKTVQESLMDAMRKEADK